MKDKYKFSIRNIKLSIPDDGANLPELFEAFHGFLISAGWQMETISEHYREINPFYNDSVKEKRKCSSSVESIFSELKRKEITAEEALEALAEMGYQPSVVCDSDNLWSVFFSNLYAEPDIDISTYSTSSRDGRKGSIYEALIYQLGTDIRFLTV